MKNKRLAAVLLAFILLFTLNVRADDVSPATATPVPETATPVPETATPVPATATPVPETATPVPATATPVPATATPVPATATPVPETATPVPETATPVPATATPVPTGTEQSETARPGWPRAFFDASWAVVDVSQAVQGGYIIAALPIGIEMAQGARIYSNARGSQSGWRPDGDNSPLYFSQAVMEAALGFGWDLESAGAYDPYDLFGVSVKDMIDYAPEGNPWQMMPGTPYNAGYTVFRLEIYPDTPAGRYRLTFKYDTGDDLMNEEPLEFIMDVSIAAAPDETDEPADEPTDEPADEPTDEPDATDPPDEPGESEKGRVDIGQMAVQTLKAGQTGVTMAVPVSYTTAERRVYSNRDDEGSVLQPGAEGFSEDILEYIDWLNIEITAEAAADPAFPFSLSEQGVSRPVIADGVNGGYAVFSDLTVKKGLSNGAVAVPFAVRYRDLISGETLSGELTALVNITGASSGYGGYSGYSGGGSSGGSYASPTVSPQARVIVESILTDPADVQAGDQFDLVLQMRNTSAKQYVHNMRVTVTAEEDALLPVSGSSTLFVDRIDAGALHELRFPVRAALDIADRPIKVDVSIEYEDAAIAAQSAVQQMIVSVAQQMRVSVGEPIMEESSLYAGDSADVSLQVINEGRTMVYNVTVTAQSDQDGVLLPAAGYLGNMEGGTSKKSELAIVPSEAGDYDVTLQVSWENARGEKFIENRTVSFSAQSEDNYDYWDGASGYTSDVMTSNWAGDDYADDDFEGETFGSLMALMPWWIYAAVAGVYFLIVVYIAVSVRARRRKAMEDDEME